MSQKYFIRFFPHIFHPCCYLWCPTAHLLDKHHGCHGNPLVWHRLTSLLHRSTHTVSHRLCGFAWADLEPSLTFVFCLFLFIFYSFTVSLPPASKAASEQQAGKRESIKQIIKKSFESQNGPVYERCGRDDRDEEVALIKLNRRRGSAPPPLVTVLIHKKICTYQKSFLFCLLSSLMKCKVGRESLWKLGSSWGRGKRPLSMCLHYLSECVFHLCMAPHNTTHLSLEIGCSHFGSLVGFSQPFHACTVKSIIFIFFLKTFTAASRRPSRRHSVSPCIEELREPRAWLRSMPACSTPCHHHKPFSFTFLLCPAVTPEHFPYISKSLWKFICCGLQRGVMQLGGFSSSLLKQMCVHVFSHRVVFAGLWGRRDHAGSLRKRPPHLQRQAADQQVRVAQNPQDLLQKEQLLHQNPTRRGKNRNRSLKSSMIPQEI